MLRLLLWYLYTLRCKNLCGLLGCCRLHSPTVLCLRGIQRLQNLLPGRLLSLFRTITLCDAGSDQWGGTIGCGAGSNRS